MCEYCGCRDIPLIGRLSEEHYEAVDALGSLRRAIESGVATDVAEASGHLAGHLFVHNDSEEAGLFHELAKDEYFAPTITELIAQHRQFRALVDRIEGGDWDAYHELEQVLRHHIDREENGLFPATAVAVDGETWAEIDRLTHDFNHEHHREHGHTEAELLELAREHESGADEEKVVAVGSAQPVLTDASAEDFTIRYAGTPDAAGLLALWAQCGLRIKRPESVAEELAGAIGQHPELVVVAVAGDSVIGSVIGTWDGRRGWMNRLAVRPDWRGRGVASTLTAEVEAGVRALGGQKVNLLLVADDYRLVDYYERLGYAAEDMIFMEKFL